MRPPEIENSTPFQREQYIKEAFRCKSNCEICGICKVLHGVTPEVAYVDYIEGKRSFQEVVAEYR